MKDIMEAGDAYFFRILGLDRPAAMAFMLLAPGPCALVGSSGGLRIVKRS